MLQHSSARLVSLAAALLDTLLVLKRSKHAPQSRPVKRTFCLPHPLLHNASGVCIGIDKIAVTLFFKQQEDRHKLPVVWIVVSMRHDIPAQLLNPFVEERAVPPASDQSPRYMPGDRKVDPERWW